MRAGDLAREKDLRAIFGELRFPTSERENSTRGHPIYLGAKPRAYQTLAERVDAALKAEPDASQERRREIEVNVARNSKSSTAYYDVTFSPVKSVYPDLLARDVSAVMREGGSARPVRPAARRGTDAVHPGSMFVGSP